MCQTTSHTNSSKNICDHGAYADLCITCHPVECETVKTAIAYTESINVAATDRQARVTCPRCGKAGDPTDEMAWCADCQTAHAIRESVWA